MRPHMSRIEPNRVEKKWVLLAFGECAACTERDENKLDVGHLYEDATSRRATRATLLVLCSGCNQAEDRSRWDSKPDRRRSKPDEVRNLAKRRYEQVLTHRHTLRTDLPPIYLKKTGFFQTQSSAFSKRSHRYGPSDGETSSQPPCRKSGDSCRDRDIGMVQRWQVLDRFSLVLYDYRKWEQAAAVNRVGRRLLREIKGVSGNPQRFELDLEMSFRREALIKGSTGTLERRETVPRLIERLVHGANDFRVDRNFDASANHLNVAATLAIEAADLETAHTLSKAALDSWKKVNHKLVIQELLSKEARYFASKRNRDKALENIVRALSFYSQCPVILEPIRAAGGQRKHDIYTDIRDLGFQLDELRDAGGTIMPSIKERALALSDTDVRRIVDEVRPVRV